VRPDRSGAPGGGLLRGAFAADDPYGGQVSSQESAMHTVIDPIVGGHRGCTPVQVREALHAEMTPDLFPAGADHESRPVRMHETTILQAAIAVAAPRQVTRS
jgi:hypothetical protein